MNALNGPIPALSGPGILGDLKGLSALFAGLREPVVVADRDRRITWLNHAAEEAFGYATHELVGRKTAELYASAADYAEQGRRRYNRRSRPSDSRYLVEYRRRSGETFLAETSGTTMRGRDGAVMGHFAIIRDVSQDEAFGGVLRALYEITSDHMRAGDDKIAAILALARERFGLPTAIVSLIEEQEYTVLYAQSSEVEIATGTRFELGRTYCVHTLRADGSAAFHQAGRSEIRAHPCYRELRLEAYIGTPLLVDGERFGTLNFSGSAPRRPFDAAEHELVRLCAAAVAQELSRARAMARLAEQARKDALTGCMTRGAFLPLASEALARARETAEEACLILFDLDHFKAVNDTHGHVAGDEVLRTIGRVGRELCRDEDVLGRLGGEEFALLCPSTDADGAAILAERLRAAIAATPVQVAGASLQVTASFGLAPAAPDAPSVEAWMEDADRALYGAKRAGRNRCIGAGNG